MSVKGLGLDSCWFVGGGIFEARSMSSLFMPKNSKIRISSDSNCVDGGRMGCSIQLLMSRNADSANARTARCLTSLPLSSRCSINIFLVSHHDTVARSVSSAILPRCGIEATGSFTASIGYVLTWSKTITLAAAGAAELYVDFEKVRAPLPTYFSHSASLVALRLSKSEHWQNNKRILARLHSVHARSSCDAELNRSRGFFPLGLLRRHVSRRTQIS